MLLTGSPGEQPQGPAHTALSRHTGSPSRGDKHPGTGVLVSRHTQQKAMSFPWSCHLKGPDQGNRGQAGRKEEQRFWAETGLAGLRK